MRILGKEDNYKYLVALYTRIALGNDLLFDCFLAILFLGNLRQEAQA